MTLLKFKKKFNKVLGICVNTSVKRSQRLLNNKELGAYVEQADALINHGGKRIRPYLMTLMYKACGGSMTPDIYRVGMILELFHNFALMHDDIVDYGEHR